MIDAANPLSWVPSANGHPDFPLHNLPLGVFSVAGQTPRGGVAIGEHILDLQVACAAGLFEGEAEAAARAASGDCLNAFFALGAPARRALRATLTGLLAEGSPARMHMEALGDALLPAMADCRLHLPARVGEGRLRHPFEGAVHDGLPGRRGDAHTPELAEAPRGAAPGLARRAQADVPDHSGVVLVVRGADPHRGGEVGGIADEPRLVVVVRRPGLAGRWATTGEG